MPVIARFMLGVLMLCLACPGVRAQTCNFTISDLAFGNVDVISGAAVDTTATLAISCGGVPLTSVRICPHMQEGSGGADAAARDMAGPGGPTLAYQIYRDPARTTVWGSGYWALLGDPPTIVLPLGLSGSANTNVTLYGRIPAGQNSAPPGSYTSSFAGAQTTIDYGLDVLGLLDCGALPILSDTATAPFTISATVQETCLVDSDDINFGMHGVLTSAVDANGEVRVTCTADTPYTVELDNGLTGSGPTVREMSNGPDRIVYALYKDAARTMPWGDDGTPGSDASGTGNGIAQALPVYGRVPPQTTPVPGAYTDMIVVTLTY